jgi:selenocysteine lyase/cysteine desulfurase
MASNRRSFLARLAAAGTVLTAAPERIAALTLTRRTRACDENGLPLPIEGPLPLEFWHDLRKEFLIPPDEAFFNTGTLGASPRIVREAVIDHMNHVDRDIAHWDYKADHEQYFTGYAQELWVREKLARLINAEASEVALTQNATFGMNFIANGLDLGVGAEVIVQDNAHPGGRCGWQLRDKRYGANVKMIHLPAAPRDPASIIKVYEDATTPQTRVWTIAHLTSSDAIVFPVNELCRRARERGIYSIIDGAQTLGHFAIDVKAMGCDAYFSSPHKWLLAPKGTGLLYLRSDFAPKVWSTLASTEWDNHSVGAYRLMQYGTGNLSLLKGLEKAIDFHAQLGPKRVEERIIGLADRLRAGLQQINGVQIYSSLHPEIRSATTVWGIRGMPGGQIQDELWNRSKVRVRAVGEGVRHCCHIYNMEEEVDRALASIRGLAKA